MFDPAMIIEVGKAFTQYNFREFAKNYVDTLDLQFVRTATEKNDIEFDKWLAELNEEDNDTNTCSDEE